MNSELVWYSSSHCESNSWKVQVSRKINFKNYQIWTDDRQIRIEITFKRRRRRHNDVRQIDVTIDNQLFKRLDVLQGQGQVVDSGQQGSNLAIGPGPGWVGVELVENLERVEIPSLTDEVVKVRKGKLKKEYEYCYHFRGRNSTWC